MQIVFSVFVSAQEPTQALDSLHRAFSKAQNDTARIVALCSLAERYAIVEYNDSLGRAKASEAFHLAERLVMSDFAPLSAYYKAMALQALGASFRFTAEANRPLGEPYFQAALEEARLITEPKRSLRMQASVLSAWFTGLRFRIRTYDKGDKPLPDLKKEAERLLQDRHEIAEKLNDNALRGHILLDRAIVLTDSGARRILLTTEAVRFYEQSANEEGLARTLLYLGFFADRIGDFPRAMEAYKRAVRVLDSLRLPSRSHAVAYSAIGDIYAKLSDTAQALAYYERAEPYSAKYDMKFNRIELLQRMGEIYHRRGQDSKARSAIGRAIALNREMLQEGYTAIRFGQLYRQQGNLQASLDELTRALRWAETTGKNHFYEVLHELTLTYMQKAGQNAPPQGISSFSKAIDSARLFAHRSLAVLLEGEEARTADRFLNTYTLLYRISKSIGNMQEALEYHEEMQRWKDSTVSNQKVQAIAALESRAVVEAIEAKIETLEAKDRLQHLVAVMIGMTTLGLVIIVGLLAWRYNERKRAATVLQVQNDQLTALNIEKNEFLGIAAHDLKNPLSVILSSAEILEHYHENDKSALDFVRLIINTSERMLDIIKNLLDINRIESGNMAIHTQPLRLTLVDNIVADYRQRAVQKNITLHYSPASDDEFPMVLADKQALTQVIDNLISNAIKYSPHGKNVFVRVIGDSSNATNDQSTNAPITNERIRIEIQDEGPGISADDMKKLFGKFARLSARPTGGEHSTGLGLSIVKKMVEAMNGRVWCESELGKGATFIVELPRA